MNIQCPRCGSENAERIDDKSVSLAEYDCKGKCSEGVLGAIPESTYFQYDTFDNCYSWPARVQWKLHEDDLEQWRQGKIQADII